jgi:hypothetical protein
VEGLWDPTQRPTSQRRRMRETKQAAYQRQGFASVGSGGSTQGAGGLRPLSSWRTMDPAKRQKVEGNFQEQYGVTMRQASRTVGRNIDIGFSQTRKAAKAAGWKRPKGGTYEAEGQRFYHGDDPDVATPQRTKEEGTFSMDRDVHGRDPAANRAELHELGQQHGVDFNAATAVRATVSPRVKLPGERRNAQSVFAHVEAGKKVDTSSSQQFSPGEEIEGVALQGNAQKAARIVSEAKKGVDPLDVQFPRMARGENTGQPVRNKKTGEVEMGKALSGPKVEGYHQSYVHPNDPRIRGAMDVHAFSQAKPDFQVNQQGATKEVVNPKFNPEKEASRKRGKPQTPKIKNPAWQPNAEDLAKEASSHEFMDEAHRLAAKKRGLVKTEAQSTAWHVQRRSRGITDPEDRGGD